MKYLFILLLLVSGGSFFIINSLEPLRCDDLIYQYYWLPERTPGLKEPIDLCDRIDNYNEAFHSQINHYLVMNGRFIIHFLVSCFCGFLGKPLFNVINTCIYILFIIGCVRLLDYKFDLKSIVLISILWLGLPIQYIFWFSVSFAINYLWTSTALIFFLILFRSQMQKRSDLSIIKLFILFVVSFTLGTLHEGISLPLSGALLMYGIQNWSLQNKNTIAMTIGVCLGTLVVVLAPGTIGRGVSSMSNISFVDLLNLKLDVLRYSKRLYLLLIFVFFFFVVNKERIMKFLKQYQLLFYFIFFDFLFVLSVPHYSQRIEFPLEMLSLLLCIGIFLDSRLYYKLSKTICVLLVGGMLVHMSMTDYYIKIVNNEYTEMINEFLSSPKGETHYRNFNIPKLFASYVPRLDKNVERDFISFVYKKEMIIIENK